jgi:hypothetical protein
LRTLHSDGLQEIAHGFMSVQEREWIRDVVFLIMEFEGL